MDPLPNDRKENEGQEVPIDFPPLAMFCIIVIQ